MTADRSVVLTYFFMCLFVLSSCHYAVAQSAPADPTALVDALKPKLKTRALDLTTSSVDRDRGEKRKKYLDILRNKGTRGLTLEERSDLPKVVSDRPTVDLEVYFDYDSAAITVEAKPTLTSLGKALQAKELKGQSFLLAGHTDGTGNHDYNQILSERRAAAVRDFLVANFGVRDSDLLATGFGQDQLKIPSNPAASQNRRVQVINVGE